MFCFFPPRILVHGDGFQELSLQSNDNSCLSRFQSTLYRKESSHMPSSYLISKLRQYEALHKRCGPYTESYNRTIRKLESGNLTDESSSDCKYLVKIQSDGLGNRILSLASAFLYALLTNRVLLVYDDKGETADLFCEPFPDTSWLLPMDFPVRNQLRTMNKRNVENYGSMVKVSGDSPSQALSSGFVYHHLILGYDDNDKRFFCDQDQIFLQNVSWVIMKSHFYFAPALFFIESFEKELTALFPEKDTVFHFLGRYLFLPSNPTWDLITRYYETYLAKSDEKIGIQVRTFQPNIVATFYDATFTDQAVPDTVVSCSLDNGLLPKIETNESVTISQRNRKSIAVLLTSLTYRYFDKIRDAYWDHPTVNRDVIGIFQASSEGNQKTGDKMHNRKAWAEMYLLSLTDKLITSPWSTFGYVAQGLGGLRPWILHMPSNETVPNPACTQAGSMEPCFHFPPSHGCKEKSGIDSGALVPHVRHCEDLKKGLKLFEQKASY
uniref:galactoside 2-alpha-L-fucosyltransferase-like n=1 Tax=Erigeron canadensis TaxID=72917 RepID=UPI001CB8AAB0|nr:galactoside 2-alpha-L-fucosyltransferase-like [Erigeron canadensis]